MCRFPSPEMTPKQKHHKKIQRNEEEEQPRARRARRSSLGWASFVSVYLSLLFADPVTQSAYPKTRSMQMKIMAE